VDTKTEYCYECGSEETGFVVEVNGIEFPVCYNCFEQAAVVENQREQDEELKRSFEERWKNFTSRLSS